ncbi:MAG: hypothetical protein KF905_12345 [Flavobacteriales bacterium]|nr:hypothetical protein [Flavobacteriales bacterium]
MYQFTPSPYRNAVAIVQTRARTQADEAISSIRRSGLALSSRRQCVDRYFQVVTPILAAIDTGESDLEAYSNGWREADLQQAILGVLEQDPVRKVNVESEVYGAHRKERELCHKALSRERSAVQRKVWMAIRHSAKCELSREIPRNPSSLRRRKKDEPPSIPDGSKGKKSGARSPLPQRIIATVFLFVAPATGAHAATDIIKDPHAKYIFVPVLLYVYWKRFGHEILGSQPFYRSERSANLMVGVFAGFLIVALVAKEWLALDMTIVDVTAFAVATICAELVHRV